MNRRFVSLTMVLLLVLSIITLPGIVLAADYIYVGSTKLPSGSYLAVGATTPTTTQPAGGYAYYSNGVLTLQDFAYTGVGTFYFSGTQPITGGYSAVIHSEHDLVIDLKGKNVFVNTHSMGDGIVIAGNLTTTGTGSLSLSQVDFGLWTQAGKLSLKGGHLQIEAIGFPVVSMAVGNAQLGGIIVNGSLPANTKIVEEAYPYTDPTGSTTTEYIYFIASEDGRHVSSLDLITISDVAGGGSGSATSSVPTTGDESQLLLWGVLIVLSAMTAIYLISSHKKARYHK